MTSGTLFIFRLSLSKRIEHNSDDVLIVNIGKVVRNLKFGVLMFETYFNSINICKVVVMILPHCLTRVFCCFHYLVLLKDVETQTTMSLDNLTQEPTETTANGDIPKIKIEDDDESEELDSATNGGQLDEKLKRLSWHSSTTSYIAWRLASPVLPSPERKQCRSRTGSACV